jgi:hypothetical protein
MRVVPNRRRRFERESFFEIVREVRRLYPNLYPLTVGFPTSDSRRSSDEQLKRLAHRDVAVMGYSMRVCCTARRTLSTLR